MQGSSIVVTTHSGVRHEGTLVPHDQSVPGVNLKDAKDLVNPGAPRLPTYFIPVQQISSWARADLVQPAPAMNGSKALDSQSPLILTFSLGSFERFSDARICYFLLFFPPQNHIHHTAFRTDRDIGSGAAAPRERELQAWKPDGTGAGGLNSSQNGQFNRDALTFGAPVNGKWDQFAANEKLFGVSTDYNEEMYTTKLDRSTSDYRERERKAQQIAAEIEGVSITYYVSKDIA